MSGRGTWRRLAVALSAGACLGLLLASGSGWADVEEGVHLPDGSAKVAEHRYRAPGTFEQTMRFYRDIYPVAEYPRRLIANQPGIKAVHIDNPGGRGWEGLNIYEANDETRIYIVPESAIKPPKRRGSRRR